MGSTNRLPQMQLRVYMGGGGGGVPHMAPNLVSKFAFPLNEHEPRVQKPANQPSASPAKSGERAWFCDDLQTMTQATSSGKQRCHVISLKFGRMFRLLQEEEVRTEGTGEL